MSNPSATMVSRAWFGEHPPLSMSSWRRSAIRLVTFMGHPLFLLPSSTESCALCSEYSQSVLPANMVGLSHLPRLISRLNVDFGSPSSLASWFCDLRLPGGSRRLAL